MQILIQLTDYLVILVADLFPASLKDYLVHATSWAGYWAIVQRGEIQPNKGGFPCSYYKNYYCREKNSISLLDLRAVEAAYLKNDEPDSDWMQVFSLRKPFTILLAIAPELVVPNLHLPNAGENNIGTMLRPFMDPGEVCHNGPIPIVAVSKVIVAVGRCFVRDVTSTRDSKQSLLDCANELLHGKFEATKDNHRSLFHFPIPPKRLTLEDMEDTSVLNHKL